MGPESSRLHIPPDLHGHEDPPDEAAPGQATQPVTPEDVTAAPAQPIPPPPALAMSTARLWREDGKVLFQKDPTAEPEPARLVWSRPLSGRGGPVSVMLAGKKRELAYFPSVDSLDEESRKVALEELDGSLVLPKISVIYQVKPRFGNYYWDVETNLGRRRFLLSAPENNTIRPTDDVIVIRDVSGNCYEIPSVSALGRSSRREMDRVL